MHIEGPVRRMFIEKALKNFLGLRICFMLLLGAFMLCATATAAPAKGDKPAGTQAKQADPSQFVGSETCATCHEETAKKFADNPHTKIAEMHGKSGVTCEGCHGPGKAHVEGGGDMTKIFNPAKASTKEVDATCLGCHAGTHPNFERSPHAKANVGCISCHSVHKSDQKAEHLLKASQPNALLPVPHRREASSSTCRSTTRSTRALVKCSRLPRPARHLREQQPEVDGGSERDLHQVPHGDARAFRV